MLTRIGGKYPARRLAVLVVLAMTATTIPVTALAVETDSGLTIGGPANRTAGETQKGPSDDAVEAVDERDAFTRVWVEPDGSRVAEIHSSPIFFQNQDGEWQEYDTSLGVNEDGEIANGDGPFDVDFSQSADTPVLMTFAYKGEWVRFGAPWAADVSPDIDGSTIRYNNVAPGTDLQYRVSAYEVKELIYLEGAMAPTSFEFEMTTSPGIASVALTADGSVIFADAHRLELFRLPTPVAWDSAGEPSTAAATYKLEANESGWILTVSVNSAWAAASGRVFPLILDPTVNINAGASGDLDAYVKSGPAYANQNFTSSNIGGFHHLLVGYYWPDTSHGYAEIYQKYPGVANYVGWSISSASWWAYFSDLSGGLPATEVSLRPLNVSATWMPIWATWNGWRPPEMPGIPVNQPSSYPWYGADITSAVRNWVSGLWGWPSEAGFAVTATNRYQTSGYARIAANENSGSTYDTQLFISYSAAPYVNTPSPANGATVGINPTLSGTVVDPEGSAVTYNFVVCNNSDPSCNSPVWSTSPTTVPSGTNVSAVVVSGLNYQTTYWWYLVVSDGGQNFKAVSRQMTTQAATPTADGTTKKDLMIQLSRLKANNVPASTLVGWMNHICSEHRNPAKDDYIGNLTILNIADYVYGTPGQTYFWEGAVNTVETYDYLDAIAPYLPGGSNRCFDNVFVGTVLPRSSTVSAINTPFGDPMDLLVGIRDGNYRLDHAARSQTVAQAFVNRYPNIYVNWYESFEAQLTSFRQTAVDPSTGQRHAYREYYEWYTIDLSNRLNLVKPDRALMWSPYFSVRYSTSVATNGLKNSLTTFFTNLKTYTTNHRGIDWLHFQDGIGATAGSTTFMRYVDVKNWYNWLKATGSFASFAVNMEQFGGGGVPGTLSEHMGRENYYQDNGMLVGASFEIRYWMGCNSTVSSCGSVTHVDLP